MEGNTVAFLFSATFKRIYGGFSGTGEQGYPGRGDQVTLSGQEPILFYPGISPTERGRTIVLTVTSVDIEQDTFQGFWTAEIEFPGPSSMGVPWRSRVAGCCRLSALQHAPSSHFEITASVNLEAMLAGSVVNASGSIASVATLHVLPGHGEFRFPVVHPHLPPLVSCSTRAAKECEEAARLLRCDLDTLLYPVDGIDCSPFIDTCLRPFCNPPAAAESRDADEFGVTPEEILGLFLRQVQPEEGGSAQPDAQSCWAVFDRGGGASCVRTAGCCWEEAQSTCAPCIAVSAQGTITTSRFTPPGLYPLSLALSSVPAPGRGVCVDSVVEWRSEEGLRCSEVFSSGKCGSNGTMGELGCDVCCECGGGEPTGGPAEPLEGIDGEYMSASCLNASSAFSAVSSSSSSPSSALSGTRVFWNASLRIEYGGGRFRAAVRYEEFSTPPRNHSGLGRNATAPCEEHVLLFSVGSEGLASVDASHVSIDHQGPKLVWVDVQARVLTVRSREGELVAADRCRCLGLNATTLAESQARGGANYSWVAQHALDHCNASSCELLRRAGENDAGWMAFEYTGTGGRPQRGACVSELMIPGAERRACGWKGVERGQCEAMGCCWSETRGAPFCSQRSYRDIDASVVLLRCDAARSRLNQSCGVLSLPAESGSASMSRARRAAPASTRAAPPAITTTELTLAVEPESQVQLHTQELGAPALAALNVTLLHSRTHLRSEALEAFTGLESRYQLKFSPSAWRVESDAHPGTLHYIITHADVPSTSTPAPPPSNAEDPGYASEEPALSEVRLEWRHLPRGAELFPGLKCMQGRVLVSCVDVDPSWEDPRGRNCSTLHSLSLCPGLIYTSPASPPLSPAPAGPIRPQLIAREVCCACGGGNIKALWTEPVCVPSIPKPDPPPKLYVASQPVILREPCEFFPLGDPPRPVRKCTKPVLSPPCRPPFTECVDAEEGFAVTYPKRVREETRIGEIGRVVIRNGGLGCKTAGFLGADPATPFGHGFSARFEIAEPGTFRGTSGAITGVEILHAGSGYPIPPALVIASGGQGCSDYAFEAVLSDRQYQLVPVYPGVGLDIEIIVGDVSFQDVTAVVVAQAGLDRMPRAELAAANRAPGWSSRRLQWRPSRLSSGDYPFPLCLSASDRGVEEGNKTVAACLALHVVRCRYAIQDNENIESVAAYYSTNWIQIWAMNPGLVDPDGILDRGQIISFGHVHIVGQGELLDWLTRKFGMSYEQVFNLNADLAHKDVGVIGHGQELCLIPNSCSTNL